jgi:hypothetical protein
MSRYLIIARSASRVLFPVAAVALLAAGLAAGLAAATEDNWSPAGKTRGVTLDSRPTPAGYRAYRGSVRVCTDLRGLQRFVADASRLHEWIPYTEEARALPGQRRWERYYLRTSAPWPFKSRDMVYRLVPEPAGEVGTIHIRLEGLPDALPEREDAVRMTSADGRWTLTPRDGHIRVALSLAVNPGPVPTFFANRRMAATVAGTLTNLAEQFPCKP